MKLKNLIVTGFAALLTIAPLPVSAHTSTFADTAGLVETEDYNKINDALWDVHVDHNCNVNIVTTNTLDGLSIDDYADTYYYNMYGNSTENQDGILLVVCTSPNQYYIMTSGSCIYSFTDAGLDFIEAQIVPKMRKDDFNGAFLTFADLCDDYMVQAEKGKPYDGNHMPKEPYNVGLSLLIALGVGLAAGGIGIIMLFANLKSVHQQHGAADYKKPNSFHLDMHRDLYLYRKVERKEKPQENNRSGGSSTHTGASGQTRGGSGGTF